LILWPVLDSKGIAKHACIKKMRLKVSTDLLGSTSTHV
jgi:hypothetical protein